MNRIKESTFELCDRCGGTGKLDWTDRDSGVCYKCEGRGYKGPQNDEFDKEIERRRNRKADLNRKYKILDNLSKAIYPPDPRLGKSYGGESFDEIAYTKLTDPNSKIKAVSKWKLPEEAANLFEIPHVIDYEKELSIDNPSAHVIRKQKLLKGKKATISKIGPTAVQVDLGIQ